MTLTALYLRLAAVVAVSGAGYFTADAIFDEDGTGTAVVALAEEVSAAQSFTNIADAAYYGTLLGEDWESALKEETELARHNDAVSVNGTRLFWRHGEICYTADLPTPESKVEVKRCY